MATFESFTLATGATTTGGLGSADVGDYIDAVALEINVTVAGTTGTYQLEGSMDGSNWFAVTTIPNDTETAALTQTYTTTGRRLLFLKNDLGKFYRFYRVNATTLTGQTYSATLWAMDQR